MSYLLDTNIVSELRKGARANRGVAAWLAEAADDELYPSVLTAGELRRGVDTKVVAATGVACVNPFRGA